MKNSKLARRQERQLASIEIDSIKYVVATTTTTTSKAGPRTVEATKLNKIQSTQDNYRALLANRSWGVQIGISFDSLVTPHFSCYLAWIGQMANDFIFSDVLEDATRLSEFTRAPMAEAGYISDQV